MTAALQQEKKLLSNRVYVRVYSAYAAAAFGDWFDVLAIQVLAGYRWHASPLMLALIPVAIALPGVLLGSAAGVAADRLNKLRLMRICDLVTALLTLLVLLVPNMAWLLPIVVLRAAASTLNVPAQQALTRQLVREDQLLQAASMNGIVNQGSKIAGPLLGGVALSFLTPHWCILLCACFRLCSYGLLLTVKKAEAAKTSTGRLDASRSGSSQTLRSMWKEGWSFIIRSRLLLSTMLFGLTGAMAIELVDFQFTSLFRIIAPNQEAVLGWMVAAAGAGALLIITLMNRWNRETGYGWKLGGGYMLIGAAIGGLGLLPEGTPILPVLGLGFVMGAGNGAFMITFNYCLQKETPPHMTGRIFGIQSSVLGVVMIAAPLLGGLMVQAAGPGRIFLVLGLVIAALGLVGAMFGKWIWPHPERSPEHIEAVLQAKKAQRLRG